MTSPNLPSLPNLDPDTSRGKRTTQLDLTSQEDLNTLLSLIKEGDVFLQAYRPNGLEEKGCGPSDLAAIRQGIICANLRAWGWDGPWKDRRGVSIFYIYVIRPNKLFIPQFDSLVQTATGFNHDESVAFSSFKGTVEETAVPKPFPVQALDHAAGYLLTFGILSAFCKSITVRNHQFSIHNYTDQSSPGRWFLGSSCIPSWCRQLDSLSWPAWPSRFPKYSRNLP